MTRDDVELYRTFARAAWPNGESRTLTPEQRRAIVRGVRACLESPPVLSDNADRARALDAAYARAVRQVVAAVDHRAESACAERASRATYDDVTEAAE